MSEIQARVIDVPLADLVHGYRSEALDDQGNRLVVRRRLEIRSACGWTAIIWSLRRAKCWSST